MRNYFLALTKHLNFSVAVIGDDSVINKIDKLFGAWKDLSDKYLKDIRDIWAGFRLGFIHYRFKGV